MLTETIRLHMNEMPHSPSQRVVEAAHQALTKLNRYTDLKDLRQLRKRLAQYAGVPECHVILSPGSDLLLRELIHTFSSGRKVVTVSPSFLPTVQAVKQFAPRRLCLRLRPPIFDLNLELLMTALVYQGIGGHPNRERRFSDHVCQDLWDQGMIHQETCADDVDDTC
jgi:histidinol-phosphate/aromatic aminotransferase/cobyric acid decarboxylase-like protein